MFPLRTDLTQGRATMKAGARNIVGRTISGVLLSENNPTGPSTQVFLLFTDGSCLEFYGDIHCSEICAGDLDWAEQYARKFGGKITVYKGDEKESVSD
jgi:hypothetical protein